MGDVDVFVVEVGIIFDGYVFGCVDDEVDDCIGCGEIDDF